MRFQTPAKPHFQTKINHNFKGSAHGNVIFRIHKLLNIADIVLFLKFDLIEQFWQNPSKTWQHFSSESATHFTKLSVKLFKVCFIIMQLDIKIFFLFCFVFFFEMVFGEGLYVLAIIAHIRKNKTHCNKKRIKIHFLGKVLALYTFVLSKSYFQLILWHLSIPNQYIVFCAKSHNFFKNQEKNKNCYKKIQKYVCEYSWKN